VAESVQNDGPKVIRDQEVTEVVTEEDFKDVSKELYRKEPRDLNTQET